MFRLIVSNLSQRPTRTFVSVLVVALGVTLLLVSLGLSYGQMIDQAERAKGVGGDFILQSSEASLLMGLNSGTLPARLQRVIQEVEGVGAITPVLTKFLGEKFQLIFGIDKDSFLKVSSNLKVVQGVVFQSPQDAMIDTIYAARWKLEPGDQLELLGHEFTVSGIFRAGVGARVFLSLPTLQELNGTPGKVTMFFIEAQERNSVDRVYDSLKEKFGNYKITKSEEIQEIMMDTAPGFRLFVRAMAIMSVTISFLIILLAMYSTVIERTREIGILKSLGASKLYIVGLILKESVAISLVGVALGFLLTFVSVKMIVSNFPTLPVAITTFWQIMAVVLAVGSGTLGALYPALQAAKMDPVKALGYE